MNTREYHFSAAEQLLAEGREVVAQLKAANESRYDHGVLEPGYATWTARMDELGKKAMGIWAQAQVHATLAGAAGF